MESIFTGSGWSEPTIIARPNAVTQPSLSTLSDGSVQLVYADDSGLQASVQISYQCDDVSLTNIGEAVYAAVRQEQFRPSSDPIPFCSNRYDRLYGASHTMYGYSDLFSWSNMLNPSLYLMTRVIPTVRIETFYRMYWLASATDAWLNNGPPRITGIPAARASRPICTTER